MATRGVNKVLIIGNLCKDPESRATASSLAITSLVVATSEEWKDKQTGEKQEKTEFHRVSMFGRLAEIAQLYLKKGSKVYIEGSLQTRKWQDKDGKDNYTTEIVAKELQMLDGKSDSAPRAQQQAAQAQSRLQASMDEFDDSTIPF